MLVLLTQIVQHTTCKGRFHLGLREPGSSYDSSVFLLINNYLIINVKVCEHITCIFCFDDGGGLRLLHSTA